MFNWAADVVALIEAVGRTKSTNVAELVFTALSEIFKHGLARHAVIVNPCAGVSVTAICGRAEGTEGLEAECRGGAQSADVEGGHGDPEGCGSQSGPTKGEACCYGLFSESSAGEFRPQAASRVECRLVVRPARNPAVAAE